MRLDEYDNPIQNVYIREVQQREDGLLWNVPIETIEEVGQFWTYDPEEFLARIGPYISAKRDADAALETSHLDPLTGFYNLRGLMRRAVEMSADTARTRRPLACVALGPPREGDAAPSDPAESTRDPDFARTLGNVLLSVTRLSDAVGRMGEGDFIILRSDGTPIYNMAVVSDDISMRITLVMRGDDHISNTPKQILLYRALGADLPRFAHLRMIHGLDGKKLSKRHGATAVADYQHRGIVPAVHQVVLRSRRYRSTVAPDRRFVRRTSTLYYPRTVYDCQAPE
jgi:GGDEF domain-containing protein